MFRVRLRVGVRVSRRKKRSLVHPRDTHRNSSQRLDIDKTKTKGGVEWYKDKCKDKRQDTSNDNEKVYCLNK
jgi:hypothetical protein